MKKIQIAFLGFILLNMTLPLFAQEPESDESLTFLANGSLTFQKQYEMLDDQREPKNIYETLWGVLDYQNSPFRLYIDIALVGDSIYDPSETYMLGRYVYINDAYVDLDLDRFYIKAGRSTQKDIIDSPYSLFVNSEPHPSTQIEAKYEGDFFFYTSRWVSLNNNSEQTYWGYGPDDDPFAFDLSAGNYYDQFYPDGVYWLDRGSNFHVYGLNLGDWSFGLQESAVFLHYDFNAELFFSPMIMYLTQLVVNGGAKPWNELANSKHVMGFFANRTTVDSYFGSQILVDDLNLSFVPGIDTNDNHTRLAWSVGGSKDFNFGSLGFYHAGATKETFASTYTHEDDKTYASYDTDQVPVYYSSRPYSYTYYPAVQYSLEDGTPMPIDYTQNYIGYKYGENNLAFMMDYTNSFYLRTDKQFSLYAAFEYVLNGAKSPVNPWHEYDDWADVPGSFTLLDDTIEHIVSVKARLDKPLPFFGEVFSVFMDAEFGMAINAMTLEPASVGTETTEPWIYRPQEGVNEPIFGLTIGASYLWRLK